MNVPCGTFLDSAVAASGETVAGWQLMSDPPANESPASPIGRWFPAAVVRSPAFRRRALRMGAPWRLGGRATSHVPPAKAGTPNAGRRLAIPAGAERDQKTAETGRAQRSVGGSWARNKLNLLDGAVARSPAFRRRVPRIRAPWRLGGRATSHVPPAKAGTPNEGLRLANSAGRGTGSEHRRDRKSAEKCGRRLGAEQTEPAGRGSGSESRL